MCVDSKDAKDFDYVGTYGSFGRIIEAIDKSRKGEKSDVVGAFLGMQDAQKEKIENILKGR